MDALSIGLLSLAAIMVLIALRLPIGVALGGVTMFGFAYLTNWNVALGVIRETPFVFSANWDLTAIPMFLLMGAITNNSGISSSLFRAARLWFAALPGGLAVATNFACAGFAAACGSSIAAAAAMARLATPEMVRAGYDKGLATGVVASAGTLAALIPPSILFVLYGIFAEVSIVELLIAGVFPGLLTAGIYAAMIMIRCVINPDLAPKISDDELAEMKKERWTALKDVWPLLVLILGIIGGLYGGVVTPTEGGAAGASLALVIGILQKRMNLELFIESLRDAIGTTAQIFFVGMGAVMYTKFLALAGVSTMMVEMIGAWAGDPILLVIAASIIYVILGMFLDPLGIMLITIPVLVPMFVALDLNLVWFGVIVVKYVEIGLLTPPVGFNVYVVKNVVGDSIALHDIFKGCFWFLGCEVIIMTLLIAFPEISLWLPATMK
ncbi:MAG: TRAP transporter large permease subunit [Rhodospirillaceae bacterium]|jgi:tripartite ATP-independent transporter DctM subunit|nr:TRAP transporter large permease subunit [Rhodospirillaceae bacterium]MBT3887281.1 TRAP transporter large permease subunit [Rhodospirillaceae bacterium]MBT4117639.1 TRAP transporter large permease subunit [Rhodospirillaceae bacterium]MBT4670790.1 TRAP transporter large permease subunit [Rhodospirillaceae bacterium]MBT4749797.1 TRAP transporter large permease subunit [Rhodospirillaceae bacterium]